eukprot:1250264-Rhodomonas_salina.2
MRVLPLCPARALAWPRTGHLLPPCPAAQKLSPGVRATLHQSRERDEGRAERSPEDVDARTQVWCARSGNTSKTANVDPGCWYPPDERHLPDPIKEPIEIFGYLHACALDQEQVGPDAARFFSSNKSSSPYCACFPSVM